jgi:hypothetical protein
MRMEDDHLGRGQGQIWTELREEVINKVRENNGRTVRTESTYPPFGTFIDNEEGNIVHRQDPESRRLYNPLLNLFPFFMFGICQSTVG